MGWQGPDAEFAEAMSSQTEANGRSRGSSMSRARAAFKRADSRLEGADSRLERAYSNVRERNMGQLPRPAPFEMRTRTRVAGTHQKRPPCTVEGFARSM